jgi:CRP/FNR family transcriptional regulator, cyclic AMP receptor protein
MNVHYQTLQDARLFRDFPDDVLIDLAKECHYIELLGGQSLFQQSDPGNNLYLLSEGQIHVVRHYPTGEDVIIATEGPYYVIGELSMLANQPRTGDVIAVSDSTLIALAREDFMTACERVPEVATALLSYLSFRLYRMNLLIRENAIGNVSARIANVLMMLSGDKSGTVATGIRINRIARAVAIDVDTVDQILREWVDRGYITLENRTLTPLDIEAINNIAG